MANLVKLPTILPQQPGKDWVAPDDPQLLLVRHWQSARLARTYADLRAAERYRLACDFFLNDIYSPTGFSQHRDDIARIYRLLPKFLPEYALEAVAATVELYDLSEQLDQTLRRVLVTELSMDGSLTAEMYAHAYYLCDNYVARARQIDLVIKAGRGVDRLANLNRIAITLRLARTPAKLAGWESVHSFLQRGLLAFQSMRGPDAFLQTVYERETRILHQIFSADADPFNVA